MIKEGLAANSKVRSRQVEGKSKEKMHVPEISNDDEDWDVDPLTRG